MGHRLSKRHLYRWFRPTDHQRETYCGRDSGLKIAEMTASGAVVEPCCGAAVPLGTVCPNCLRLARRLLRVRIVPPRPAPMTERSRLTA
jgi:hypothetical protein